MTAPATKPAWLSGGRSVYFRRGQCIDAGTICGPIIGDRVWVRWLSGVRSKCAIDCLTPAMPVREVRVPAITRFAAVRT